MPRSDARDRERRGATPSRARDVAEAFTVLEKLALRALPGRQVPAESGVRFAISSQARQDGLCLVLLVDDRDAPIYPDADGPRPDYLVVHASRRGCVLTIVEMKGRDVKGTDHGVDQILAFYRRLKQEMARCLPGSWRRATIQGLLLMPENAQFNRKRIADARREGLAIYPLPYHHQAELYDYVSRPITVTEPYKHRRLPRDTPELNPLELLLTTGRIVPRIRDARFAARRGAAEDTLYLNFRRPGDPAGAHVTLATSTRDAVLAFAPAASAARRQICAHLESHGLQCPALRIDDGASP